MSDFFEGYLPLALPLSASSGPMRKTEIVTLASGHEVRNSRWAGGRRRYDIGGAIKTIQHLYQVMEFFEARKGQLVGFRFKDFLDWHSAMPGMAVTATDQPLGLGDGVQNLFQLVKHYGSGADITDRLIIKPKAGSVKIAIDGTIQTEGVDFTIDTGRGGITFSTAPASGAVLTAGFEFDTPVRFDSDSLQIALAGFEAGRAISVPLIEILCEGAF